MRRLKSLFNYFLVFFASIFILFASFSLSLTNANSLISILSFLGGLQDYQVEIIFNESKWHPFKPVISLKQFSLKSYSEKGFQVSLEDLTAEINLFRAFAFHPLSKLSIKEGYVVLDSQSRKSFFIRRDVETSFLNSLLLLDYLDLNDLHLFLSKKNKPFLKIDKVFNKNNKVSGREVFLVIKDKESGTIKLTLKSSGDLFDRDYIKGHINFNKFQLPKDFFYPSCQECKTIRLDSQLWFSLFKNKLINLEGWFKSLGSVPFFQESEITANISLIDNREKLNFLIHGSSLNQKHNNYKLPQIFLSLEEESPSLLLPEINLEDPFIQEALLKSNSNLFKNVDMEGVIKNLYLIYKDGGSLQISGSGEKIYLNDNNRQGNIKNLSGKFLVYENRAIVKFDSPNVELDLKNFFNKKINIADFKGDVFISHLDTNPSVLNNFFSASINSVPFEGKFSYRNISKQIENFSVSLSAKDSPYFPIIELVPNLETNIQVRPWLFSHLKCGVLDQASLLYRGPLIEDSEKATQTFQMDFRLKDSCIDLDPLILSEVNLIGQIDNSELTGKIISSDLFDSDLSSEFKIFRKDKNSPFNIELIGEFSGPFETLIKLFSKTSSYSNIANTQEATIKGKQVTKFSFNSPLSISPFNVLHKNSLLSVRTKISRGLIKLKDQKNYLSNIFSNLIFDTKNGFGEGFLSAKLNSIPLEFNVETTYMNQHPFSVVSSELTLSDKNLVQLFPFLGHKLKGRSEFELSFKLPSFLRGYDLTDPELLISSSLKGYEINLPKPFDKTQKDSLLFNLNLSSIINKNILKLNFVYGDIATGVLLFNPSISSGSISLGPYKRLSKLTQGKINITGYLNQLNLSEYKELFITTDSSFNRELVHLQNLKIKEINLGSFTLQNSYLDLIPEKGNLRFLLTNQNIKGTFLVKELIQEGLEIDLDYWRFDLNFYQQDSKNILSSLNEFLDFPIIFSIKDLSINDESYGSWSFKLNSENKKIILKDLEGEYAGWNVGSGGDKKISNLLLKRDGHDWKTYLNTSIYSNQPNKALKNLGFEINFSSEMMEFYPDVTWNGLPFDFNQKTTTGNLGFNIKKLYIEEYSGEMSESAALYRLIGIFNLTDMFEKTTNLNFNRPFSGRGYRVDRAKGDLEIDKYKISTKKPIIFESGSSEIKWEGVINKSKHGELSDIDFQVIVTLPLREYLPAYAFLLGGPLTAGVVYIAGKAFEKELDKLSSGKWRIWGLIEEPKEEFLGWFEN